MTEPTQVTRSSPSARSAGAQKMERPNGEARSSLRSSVREMSFAEGEHALSPVQCKPDSRGKKPTQTPRERAPGREQASVGSEPPQRRETLAFSDPEVIAVDTYPLLAGSTPAGEIDRYVSSLGHALNMTATNFVAGIQRFARNMSEPPDESPSLIESMLEAAVTGAFDFLLAAACPVLHSGAAALVTGWLRAGGKTYSQGLSKAATDKMTRSFNEFLAATEDDVLGDLKGHLVQSLITGDELKRVFETMEGTRPDTSPDGACVTGEKARFLKDLKGRGTKVLESVPMPEFFFGQIASRWVTDPQAGGRTTETRDPKGIVEIHVSTERTGRQEAPYTFELSDYTLKVATRPENALNVVKDLLRTQNLWTCGIPVRVSVELPQANGGWSPVEFRMRGAADPQWLPPLTEEARDCWGALKKDSGTWLRMAAHAASKLETE